MPQSIYERARKVALRRRVYNSGELVETMRNHGVSGLFIDPERTLLSTSPPRTLTDSRVDTAFHHAHLKDDVFETIATSLAEGIGISSIARIQKVDKKTVLLVLVRAAKHVSKINCAILRNLEVSECQLDEMWSFVGKKEKNLDAIEKLQRILGDAWIWVAFDAVNKIFLATVIGKRTLPQAVYLLEEVKRVTSRMPTLFSSDQLGHYANALLQVYANVVYPPHKSGPGRPPNPKLIPPHDLLYVHVVKQYKKNRLLKIGRKIIFGAPELIAQILKTSAVSTMINTSYVERANGTIRHVDARTNRKTYRFSKKMMNHKRQLTLSLAYYHFCRPHKTLSKRHGRLTTPFMAAGLTDRVWTMGEVLGCSLN